jgi:pimeloyl-ACP methyl ester carboxylesterase
MTEQDKNRRRDDEAGAPTRRDALKMAAAFSAVGVAATAGHMPSARAASDGTISHTMLGDGPSRVIVLHDWSVDTAGDYGVITPFFDTSKLTLAFADVRGYGGSRDMTGEYTVEEISADVARLADSLGWDRFSILGHSMTGMAVQKVMADMPARLACVVATVPVPASGFPLDDETFAFFESMATDDANFKQGMHALTSGRYGEEWAQFKLEQNRSSVLAEAMAAYTTMWSKGDFSAEVAGNETPILIVYGAYDNEGLRREATGPAYAEWYPNLTEHVCQSGHYPMLESAVEYVHAVQDYILAQTA